MSLVFDPPVSPPLPPAAEEGSQLWEVLYKSLGHHQHTDESGDLQRACECLMAPTQRVYDRIRERPGLPKGARMLDPANCEREGLPYLAQYVGIVVTPELEEDEEHFRAEIEQPTGWRRGQPESIRLAIQRTLRSIEGEEKMVIIRPRTPEVGHHYVRVLSSQCPDEARSARVAREEVPAWEMLDFAAIDAVTFADITAKFETFGDLTATFRTFKDLAEVLPTEL